MRVKYLKQDFEQRLHQGICLYNGRPYSLSLFNAKYVQLSPIHSESKLEAQTVEITDPLLDISSPSLGYVNHGPQALYLMRKPERRYKQTLTAASIEVFDPNGGDGWSGNVVYSKGAEEMFLNVYPSFEEALSGLSRKDQVGIAVSRNIALTRDSFDITRVYYKTDFVGTFDMSNNTVVIPNGEIAWVISRYLDGVGWRLE